VWLAHVSRLLTNGLQLRLIVEKIKPDLKIPENARIQLEHNTYGWFEGCGIGWHLPGELDCIIALAWGTPRSFADACAHCKSSVSENKLNPLPGGWNGKFEGCYIYAANSPECANCLWRRRWSICGGSVPITKCSLGKDMLLLASLTYMN
jgi:hypothetical protein